MVLPHLHHPQEKIQYVTTANTAFANATFNSIINVPFNFGVAKPIAIPIVITKPKIALELCAVARELGY